MEINYEKIEIGPAELDWLVSALTLSVPLEKKSDLKKIISGMSDIELFEYPSGLDILKEGEDGRDFFVVRSGSLSVRKTLAAEPEEIGRLGEGDFFGEMGFLLNVPRSATVRTEEKCRVFRFGAQELAAVLSGHKALEARIKEVAMERLTKTFKDI